MKLKYKDIETLIDIGFLSNKSKLQAVVKLNKAKASIVLKYTMNNKDEKRRSK